MYKLMIALAFLPATALAQGVYSPPHVVTHSCVRSPWQQNKLICQTYVNGALQPDDTTINGIPTHPHASSDAATTPHSLPWNP